MWKPEKIYFTNLISHTETPYTFLKNRMSLFYGFNYDDEGFDSNGSGKSTVIEAVSLAITGSTSRDVKKDEFIRDNEDECFIEFDLSNKIGDVKSLKIQKWFYRKKATRIKLHENGEENKELTSTAEASKRILELIGISKDDLLFFYIIGQNQNYSFLTANDSEKKQIISRFTNVDFIDEKIEKLKADKKIYDSRRQDEQNSFSKIEGVIESIQDEIEYENEEIKKGLKSQLEIYETDNEEKKSQIKNNNQEITKKNILIKKKKKKLQNSKFAEIENKNDIELKRNKTEKKIEKFNKDIREVKATISELELLKKGKIKCPNCSHDFVPESNMHVHEIDEYLSESEKIKEKTLNDKKSYETELAELEETINKIDELKDEKIEIEDEKEVIEDEVDDLNGSNDKLEKLIKANLESIEKVKKDFSKNSKINKLNKKLTTKKAELKEIENRLTEVKEKIEELDYWIYHFGKKGFKTFLNNKSIKSIEGATNLFLEKVNTDLRIRIDGFTLLSSGDIREKIEIKIIRNGSVIGSFNKYSGGEKERIKIANLVALHKLFNLASPNGGLDILALDETFDGLDITGQIECFKILEKSKITNLVITHMDKPIGADNEVRIEKENSISKIKS